MDCATINISGSARRTNLIFAHKMHMDTKTGKMQKQKKIQKFGQNGLAKDF